MTRHARNCTAGAVYTYHEKKKDAEASGYGTQNQRVGKDSVKDFDCCCLTLQPCRNPMITTCKEEELGEVVLLASAAYVCTPQVLEEQQLRLDGYLFDKEAILEYIIRKKNEISRKMKDYERQKKKEEAELAELAAAEKQSKLNNFVKSEKNIVSAPLEAFKKGNSDNKPSVSNMTEGRDKNLPSFWIPSKTPEARHSTVEKPDKNVLCPMTGKPLKMKDLIEVKFMEVKDPDDKKSHLVKENRYMCAVTHDILSNSVPCAVLRPTGDVVTMECVEKIIKKDWIHPLTSEKLTEKDIIPLQRGGTGYSLTNTKLEGKHERPVLQA